jgi:hypothetical protein
MTDTKRSDALSVRACPTRSDALSEKAKRCAVGWQAGMLNCLSQRKPGAGGQAPAGAEVGSLSKDSASPARVVLPSWSNLFSPRLEQRPYRLRAHQHRHIPGHPSVQLFRHADIIFQASDIYDEEPSSGLDLGSNRNKEGCLERQLSSLFADGPGNSCLAPLLQEE